jgi:hypothetical protein
LARRPQVGCGCWGCWRRRCGACYGGCRLQYASETADVIHRGIEREAACLLDTPFPVPAHETEQRIHAAHAGPREWSFESVASKAHDGGTVPGNLTGDVAHRIGAFVHREVTRVDGATTRALTWMGLHEYSVIVEVHEGASGTCAQMFADNAHGR